jgi:hypothetical protein
MAALVRLGIVPLRLGSGAVQTFGIHGQQGRAVLDKRLRNAGRRAERDLRVPGWCNSSVGLVAGRGDITYPSEPSIVTGLANSIKITSR